MKGLAKLVEKKRLEVAKLRKSFCDQECWLLQLKRESTPTWGYPMRIACNWVLATWRLQEKGISINHQESIMTVLWRMDWCTSKLPSLLLGEKHGPTVCHLAHWMLKNYFESVWASENVEISNQPDVLTTPGMWYVNAYLLSAGSAHGQAPPHSEYHQHSTIRISKPIAKPLIYHLITPSADKWAFAAGLM